MRVVCLTQTIYLTRNNQKLNTFSAISVTLCMYDLETQEKKKKNQRKLDHSFLFFTFMIFLNFSKIPISLSNSNFHPSNLKIRIRETFYYSNLSIIRKKNFPSWDSNQRESTVMSKFSYNAGMIIPYNVILRILNFPNLKSSGSPLKNCHIIH